MTLTPRTGAEIGPLFDPSLNPLLQKRTKDIIEGNESNIGELLSPTFEEPVQYDIMDTEYCGNKVKFGDVVEHPMTGEQILRICICGRKEMNYMVCFEGGGEEDIQIKGYSFGVTRYRNSSKNTGNTINNSEMKRVIEEALWITQSKNQLDHSLCSHCKMQIFGNEEEGYHCSSCGYSTEFGLGDKELGFKVTPENKGGALGEKRMIIDPITTSDYDIPGIGKVIFHKIEGTNSACPTIFFTTGSYIYRVTFNSTAQGNIIVVASKSGCRASSKKNGWYMRKNMDLKKVQEVLYYYRDNKDKIGFSNILA